MRHLFAFALTFVACALFGCTPYGSQTLTPPIAQSTPCADFCGGFYAPNAMNSPRIRRTDATEVWHSGYVYVADGKDAALEVYRFGYPTTPLRIVKLDGAPFGVATDDDGRVYVTEQLTSEVQVFDSGAVHSLGQLNGAYEPDGVTVAAGKVYVTNHPPHGGKAGYVSQYEVGSPDVIAVYPAPDGFAPKGVAIDAIGDRFETLIAADGACGLVKYAPSASGSTYTFIASLGESCWGGVAMDGDGNVVTGDIGGLRTYEKPDFNKSFVRHIPGSGILTSFSHDALGMFVPFNAGAGQSTVWVYPAYGSESPYELKVETPLGAAGGI